MEQTSKELLLKDLCARLPYSVHCRVFKLNETVKENDDILYGVAGDYVITLKSDKDECLMYYQAKPYLFPLSSMTEEQKKEFDTTLKYLPAEEINFWTLNTYDWCNKNHFDYRGLIEKGLAIDAIGLNIY